MAKKKKAVRRKKAAAKSIGLSIEQVRVSGDARVRELSAAVEADEAPCSDHTAIRLAARRVLLVALPIDRVEPTPYQRDPSEPTSSD